MRNNHFPRRIGAGYEYWQFERYGAWFVADLTGDFHKVDPETSRGLQLALKEDQEKQLEALVKSLSKCKPSPGRKAEKTAVKQEWWVLHAIGKYQQGLMSWEDLCGSVRGPLATFPKESRPHPLL